MCTGLKYDRVELKDQIKNKRIICYGTGANAHLMLSDKRFQPLESDICYFVDMDPRKHGKKFIHEKNEYQIKPVEMLDSEKDIIVIVTISDYAQTGRMLDQKNIEWISWAAFISDIDLDDVFGGRDNGRPRLLLMNTPDYANLGDHAIAAAEDLYIRKNFGEYLEFGSNSCTPKMIGEMGRYLKKSDIIFFQGGGNLGSLWRTYEEIFRNILNAFPDNPVIVFPQSVYYGDTNEENEYFRRSQEIYNAHKNLLICVRDKRSRDFVKNSYSCKCMLLPDMVLTLKYDGVSERKGVGVLLRHDKEQVLSDGYENTIENVLSKLGEDKIVIDHHPNKFIENRKSEISLLMKQYSECRLVITDRLHGMIFAAVTGTPCIAFDNSYHKISDLYETWLSDCPYITVSEQLSESGLLKLAEEKLMSGLTGFDNNYIMKKYDLLTEYVKKLL